MTLDSWLVARLAQELDALLRGARIDRVRALPSGLVLFCYRRGSHVVLQAGADQNAPLLGAYEKGEEKESDAEGWAGPACALLRNCTIDAIQAVPKDRVVYVDVSSRSAFGVPSHSRIAIELQPRKANVLVLRPSAGGAWTIVAAIKQFEGAGGARSARVGASYEPPPQRQKRVDRAQFIVLAANANPNDAGELGRLLGAFDPECTPPLANEVIARVAAAGKVSERAHVLLDTWSTLRAEIETALEDSSDVYVYRKDGVASICHIVPLTWPAADAATLKTVNELCVAALQVRPPSGGLPLETLRKKLTTMLARCEDESAALKRAALAAQQADGLRQAGDAIYANLAEIAPGAPEFTTPEGLRVALDPLLSAKENAAQYFRKYKKARSGLPRVRARLQTLRSNREYWEHLAWELERAQSLPPSQRETLGAEIAADLGVKVQLKPARRAKSPERKVELSGAAVAYVGRSPKENEQLTFSVAGPNDWWFHARDIPGAHVIVKTNGNAITERQIEEAAALAAGQSRAAGSGSVEVDYTQRKHVRRQSAGRPGLVWYTDFQTVRVAPKRD